MADDGAACTHTYTVSIPGLDGTPGPNRPEQAPVWAELTRIREEMLWSFMDRMLTAGALIRVAVAVMWMALALATGAEAWWGACMMLGGLLSLLHARRGMVMLIADSAGPLGRFVRWLLPYPRGPHVNPTGAIEATGAVVACIGTGWFGAAFTTTPSARAVGILASALMYAYTTSIVVNLTGHVTWEFGPIAPFFQRVRPIVSLGCSIIALAMLWPSPDLAAAYPATVTISIIATASMVFAGPMAQWFLASTAQHSSSHIHATRSATQAVDSQYVHQLKNMARILYRRADEIPSGDLRERVRRLSVTISSTEHMLKSGQGIPARCVEDVVNGLLGLDERFATLRNVDSDIDFHELTPGDAELIAIAVGDLCSNAVNARASRFRVGLRMEPDDAGHWLVLAAECVCGKAIPEVAEDSSLMRLATLLHYNRGTFVIQDDGCSHTFTLRWPTTSARRAGAEGNDTTMERTS